MAVRAMMYVYPWLNMFLQRVFMQPVILHLSHKTCIEETHYRVIFLLSEISQFYKMISRCTLDCYAMQMGEGLSLPYATLSSGSFGLPFSGMADKQV